MFSKILIANRGEIAVRIIRACKEMGISTVAVFSDADREALHVSLADESICIGPAPVQGSYLNKESIVMAAKLTGAEAVHPGYGLLSEGSGFALLCEENDLKFIGPSAKTISLAGDKDEARKSMKKAGVPTVPGSPDIVRDAEEAKELALEIGFPLLIKARSGGGGRGIRKVNSIDEVKRAFETATAEAQSAFGDGAVYMERFMRPARHIEIQLICDDYGNVVCLGERECSIQRKNQKLVEESPSPAVFPELRERMIAQNMTINLDDAAKRLVAKEGTDTAFGARPLRRAIQRMLEDPLSEQILEGRWTSGSVVDVTVSEDGEELVFSEGTGSIPAPRKRDSIARDAELLLTNYDLGHAGVGSGRGAGTPAGSLAGGE